MFLGLWFQVMNKMKIAPLPLFSLLFSVILFSSFLLSMPAATDVHSDLVLQIGLGINAEHPQLHVFGRLFVVLAFPSPRCRGVYPCSEMYVHCGAGRQDSCVYYRPSEGSQVVRTCKAQTRDGKRLLPNWWSPGDG
ncbi:hypothetical protein BKA80DRAFT_270947 [Phyllosticta citrichinensis]